MDIGLTFLEYLFEIGLFDLFLGAIFICLLYKWSTSL